MPTLINAGFVYTQDDGEVVMVGFADEEYNTKEYVLLQRILNPSQEDKQHREDEVHIEVNDQRHSGYGGVRAIRLTRDSVTILLEPSIAEELRVESEIQVAISGTDLDLEALMRSLKFLCKDYVQLIDDL
jgi:hypothetical protein